MSGGTALQVEQRGHDRSLDGVRGLAIALVLIFHMVSIFGNTGARAITKLGYGLGSVGWIGVDLFFVLSGFLITGILRRSRGEPHYYRNFFARRALRIFPLYYAFLTIFFLIEPRFDGKAWYWMYLWNYRLGTEAWVHGGMLTHFWSLAVEEQFYLVWPTFVLLLAPRSLFRICLALIALGFVSRVLCFAEGYPTGAYTFTVCHLDALASGALLTFLPETLSSRARNALCASLGASALALLLLFVRERGFYNVDPRVVTVGISLLNVFFASLVALVSRHAFAPLTRAFADQRLVWLGKYSYGIYVVHFPLAHALHDWGWRVEAGHPSAVEVLGLVSATLAASLLLASLSWQLLESRFLKLKTRFAS